MNYQVGDIVLYDTVGPIVGVVVRMLTDHDNRPVVKFWDWEEQEWDTFAPALQHICVLARKGAY